MEMTLKKIPFDEVPFPQYPEICFEKLFDKKPDFKFDLEKDCNLAHNSYNTNFDFTAEEFYLKVKAHFDECGY